MAEQPAQAGYEGIFGQLRVEEVDTRRVSREATADHRKLIALNCCVIGLSMAGIAVKLAEGEGLLKAFGLSSATVVLAMFVITTQLAARRTLVASIQQADPLGSAVNYQIGSSGFEIQRAAGSKRLAWSECSGFKESAHAFLLFVGRATPEVVFKRAFREDDLSVIRERLGANIKRHAPWRWVAIALVMGFAVLLIGALAAVASHSTHH